MQGIAGFDGTASIPVGRVKAADRDPHESLKSLSLSRVISPSAFIVGSSFPRTLGGDETKAPRLARVAATVGNASEETTMMKFARVIPVFLLASLVGLTLTTKTMESKGEEIELEEAEVFIEWNSTDTDFGIQFFWDGDAWSKMTVRNESGKPVLSVEAKHNVKAQGLTEGFFESDEPPASELSMEEFFARFPEGEYSFSGKTLEGNRIVGEAEFTHTLASPPSNLSPEAGDVVSHTGFTASFDPVLTDINGDPIEIAFYEVVVEKLDDEPILQVFHVILRPAVTSVFVPGEFLEPDTEYKLEVIAEEESGNRTITETGAFITDAP